MCIGQVIILHKETSFRTGGMGCFRWYNFMETDINMNASYVLMEISLVSCIGLLKPALT